LLVILIRGGIKMSIRRTLVVIGGALFGLGVGPFCSLALPTLAKIFIIPIIDFLTPIFTSEWTALLFPLGIALLMVFYKKEDSTKSLIENLDDLQGGVSSEDIWEKPKEPENEIPKEVLLKNLGEIDR